MHLDGCVAVHEKVNYCCISVWMCKIVSSDFKWDAVAREYKLME